MSVQSFLAKEGLRFGILGSAASLAIAAPLAAGNYSPAAHTDATRMGFYFDRTAAAEAVVTNVLGTDILSVGVLGVSSPLQIRGQGILAAEATFVYWDGTTFALGASAMNTASALAPFTKSLSTLAGGIDTGVAMYQTSAIDGVLLAGVIGISAPAAYVDPTTEQTEMFFLTRNNANALVERMRLMSSGQIRAGSIGTAGTPTWSFTADFSTGMYLSSAGVLSFSASGVNRADITTTALDLNAISLTLDSGQYIYFDSAVTLFSSGTSFTVLQGRATSGILFNSSAGSFVTQMTDQGRWYISNGDAALPAQSYIGDTDTGGYHIAANQIGWSTNGVLRFDISTAAVTSALPIVIGTDPGGVDLLRVGGAALIDGKLTVTGLIDPTGLALTPVAANPGGGLAASTLWFNSGDSSFYIGAVPIGGPFPVGSAAAPSITFTGDLDTGFYLVGANDVGVTAGGTLRLDISATAVTSAVPIALSAASAAAPGLTFTGDIDTGIFRVGADDFGIATGGVLRVDVSTTVLTSTLVMRGPDGTALLPAYSFTADPDTGMYRSGTNNLTFAAGGALQLEVTSSGTFVNALFGIINGTAANPAIVFTSDQDTGIYRVGANDLGISTNGVLRFDISATAITSTVPHVNPVGAVGAPSFTFTGDTTTGIYSPFAGQTAFTSSGTEKLAIRTGSVDTTVPVRTSSGSLASPAWSFTNDPDTGIYNSSNINVIDFVCGGGFVAEFTTTRLVLGVRAENIDGTAGTPSYTYQNDNTMGMYRSAANTTSFASAGVLRFSISSTAITSTLPGLFNSGTAAAPSYSFSADPNTGLYNVSADVLGLSTGGTLRVSLTTAAMVFASGINLTLDSGILGGFLADVVIDATTTITLSATHMGRVLRCTNGAAVAITVPNSLAIGFSCTIVQDGAGQITVSAGAGATVNNRSTQFKTAGQYAMCTLLVTANAGGTAAVAVLAGDTAA